MRKSKTPYKRISIIASGRVRAAKNDCERITNLNNLCQHPIGVCIQPILTCDKSAEISNTNSFSTAYILAAGLTNRYALQIFVD